MNKSLNGIRVLETGSSRAVRVTGMILKDLGADVIKIVEESTTGECNHSTDRRKNPIFISELMDKEKLRSLLSRADVILEDGFDSEITSYLKECLQTMDHLIRCSLPPRSDGSDSSVAWTEDSVSAASGLYETPSGLGTPRPFSLPVASTIAAFYAVNGITMALIGKMQHGKGISLSIPLDKTALSVQVLVMMIRSKPPSKWEPFRWLASPFMGVWKTAGDQYIYMHVGMPRHLRNFMFLLQSAGFIKEKSQIKELLHKNSRRDPSSLVGIKEAMGISKILHALFRTRPADYWEKLLSDAGLICSKIRSFDEWKEHPQVVGSKEVLPFRCNDGKIIQISGKLIGSSEESTVSLETGRALSIEQVLETWSERVTADKGPCERVLPLKGVRVLDMSRIIAGPFAGRFLSEYGAEVLHISVRGKHLSWEEPFHVAFNAGKRSVIVDCSRPGGKEILLNVIRDFQPDIIIHNFLDEAAEKLGIDYDSMKSINPEIVSVGIKGYNSVGPWSKRPGFEQCMQAASGILHSYSEGIAPQILPIPIIDLSTGLISSLAAALCYYQLKKGSGGTCVSTSLSVPAIYLQMDKLNSPGSVNKSPTLCGYYRAKDRLFYLSIRPDDIAELAKIFEIDLRADEITPDTLARVFRKKSFTFWQSQLREMDLTKRIQIVPRIPMSALLKNEVQKKEGLFLYREHEEIGSVLVCRSPLSMEPIRIAEISPAEPIGKSTSEYVASALKQGKVVRPIKRKGRLQYFAWFLRQCKWVLVILYRERLLKK